MDNKPVMLTKQAAEKVKEVMAQEGLTNEYLRVGILGGGCLPPDQKILTSSGFKKIKDVCIHDKVLAANGNFEQVTNSFSRKYNGKMYEIKPQLSKRFNTFYITDEHPVLIISGDKFLTKVKSNTYYSKNVTVDISEAIFVKPKEIKENDVLIYVSPDEVIDNNELDENFCKLLGYYLAEGCVTYKYKKSGKLSARRTELYFGADESNYIDNVKTILNYMGLKYNLKRVKNVMRFTINNTKLSIKIEKYCGNNNDKNKTEKFISNELLFLPIYKQKAFLEAYVDGDGNRRDNSFRMSTVSEKITEMAQVISSRVYKQLATVSYTINKNECIIEGRKCNRSPKSYEISIWAAPRKRRTLLGENTIFGMPIREINAIDYDGEVFNIEVSPSNTFCINGFATHNCSGFSYNLDFTKEINETDIVYELDGVKIAVDEISAGHLTGTTIDYLDGLNNSGFKFINPQAVKICGCGQSFS